MKRNRKYNKWGYAYVNGFVVLAEGLDMFRLGLLTLAGIRTRQAICPLSLSGGGLCCPEKDRCTNYSLGGGFYALHQTRRHFPITLIPSRAFNEALPRAELHPLDILSRNTSLSLLLEPTTHCHYHRPSLASLTTTGHLGTGLLYKPQSFGSLIPDDWGSTHLWNVGRQ
jgi:hypothetical protein